MIQRSAETQWTPCEIEFEGNVTITGSCWKDNWPITVTFVICQQVSVWFPLRNEVSTNPQGVPIVSRILTLGTFEPQHRRTIIVIKSRGLLSLSLSLFLSVTLSESRMVRHSAISRGCRAFDTNTHDRTGRTWSIAIQRLMLGMNVYGMYYE